MNGQWHATQPTLLDELPREMEETWIINSPFPKEAILQTPILELSINPRTGALVATPTGALSPKHPNVNVNTESVNINLKGNKYV